MSNGDGDVASRSAFLALGHGNGGSSIENSTELESRKWWSRLVSPGNR